jgi:hypothetical protein
MDCYRSTHAGQIRGLFDETTLVNNLPTKVNLLPRSQPDFLQSESAPSPVKDAVLSLIISLDPL